MATSRREILAAGAASLAGMSVYTSLARRAFAGPEKEIAVKPAVVCIYLRGGNDALNTLVPYTDGNYYDMRPNIAVRPPGEENGAIDLDGTFGLNPGLTGFKSLWDQKMLAAVVNCGVNSPSRSHFEMQDFMEQGRMRNSTVRSGWLNRYLQHTAGGDADFRALALQSRLPRSLRGDFPALAVAPSRTQGRGAGSDGDVLEMFDKLYKEPPSMDGAGMTDERQDADELTQNGRTTIDALRKLEEILAEKPAGKEVDYPATAGGLGRQLKMAARLLKSGQGVEAICMDWNGWDHHIREGGGGEQDAIRVMLTQLGLACSTFFEDIEFLRNKVTLVVMSEFGRTNRENGNFGTDHGHGGVMWVMGGRVNGGKVYGDWTGLAPGQTYQNRDLLVTTDWRDVLEEVLRDHMKLHPSKQVFADFTARENKLGLFQTV
ncbi:MAG: DUF1501 domain-containing protein [Planctomycetota bacterium]|nr:DUF1501 domain-containing protein [Planctomycetota bacterium]